MSYSFIYEVTPEATELRICGPRGTLSTDSWSIEAPSSLLPGVDLAQRLIAAGAAISEDDTVFIEHRSVSCLSVSEAKSLGLPPISDVVAHLETTGIIARPDFRIKLNWRRGSQQPKWAPNERVLGYGSAMTGSVYPMRYLRLLKG